MFSTLSTVCLLYNCSCLNRKVVICSHGRPPSEITWPQPHCIPPNLISKPRALNMTPLRDLVGMDLIQSASQQLCLPLCFMTVQCWWLCLVFESLTTCKLIPKWEGGWRIVKQESVDKVKIENKNRHSCAHQPSASCWAMIRQRMFSQWTSSLETS